MNGEMIEKYPYVLRVARSYMTNGSNVQANNRTHLAELVACSAMMLP